MKLHIEEAAEYEDVDITIRCGMLDEPLKKLIDQIRLYGFTLPARKNGESLLVKPEEVCYIESVDDRTFLYLDSDVCECPLRLYELEERLSAGSFVRVSKACILNISKLRAFRSQLNGKLEARLQNGERVEVNRHYVPELKRRLNEMRDAK